MKITKQDIKAYLKAAQDKKTPDAFFKTKKAMAIYMILKPALIKAGV